jgi:hypothetical protein
MSFIRTTFLCKAEEAGTTVVSGGLNTTTITVDQGDYVFRIGDERDAERWNTEETVEFTTNVGGFSGSVSAGVATFHTTQTPVAGVRAIVQGRNANTSRGTASTNETQICTILQEEEEVVIVDEVIDDEVTTDEVLETATIEVTPPPAVLFRTGGLSLSVVLVIVFAGVALAGLIATLTNQD